MRLTHSNGHVMKTLRFLTIVVAAGMVAVLVGMAQSATATIVSVDVSGTAYTGPGVLDTTSHTWLLKDTTGNTFTLDSQVVTITYGTHLSTGINATIDLFDHYKHNNGGSAFGFVLTGLDLTKQYDIVLYSAQNFGGGRGGSFDLVEGFYSGADPQSTTGDQQSSFAEGVNFVRFNKITPTNASLDQRIRFLVGNGPEGIGVFNGFEIQISVPEPSTFVLAALGLLGLGCAVKRKFRRASNRSATVSFVITKASSVRSGLAGLFAVRSLRWVSACVSNSYVCWDSVINHRLMNERATPFCRSHTGNGRRRSC